MARANQAAQRGISLIEALVALGVMAFGIMGIAGIQASLRTNSDIAKQRAEAVRLAQQLMEDKRGFIQLASDGLNPSYDDIATATLGDVVGNNATFTRSVTVNNAGTGRAKNLVVTVGWTDRIGETQSVTLSSTIAGSTPELSGSLGMTAPGGAQRQPQRRHPGVPRGGTDLGDGTSKLYLPGGDGRFWIFSNTTGVILKRCRDFNDCNDEPALLLTGFVRFATGSTQPTSADAEIPSSPLLNDLQVRVTKTAPGSEDDRRCWEDRTSYPGAVEYFCAVPISESEPYWSGFSYIDDIDLASSPSDNDDDEYRVCRYTTVLSDATVGTGTPPLRNVDHPKAYLNVDAALTNQNFLVIRAGNNSEAFTCPDDDTNTPFVNGRTFRHQPD